MVFLFHIVTQHGHTWAFCSPRGHPCPALGSPPASRTKVAPFISRAQVCARGGDIEPYASLRTADTPQHTTFFFSFVFSFF